MVYNADLKVQVDMYKLFLLLELNSEYNRCKANGEVNLCEGIERAITKIHAYEGVGECGEIPRDVYNGK